MLFEEFMLYVYMPVALILWIIGSFVLSILDIKPAPRPIYDYHLYFSDAPIYFWALSCLLWPFFLFILIFLIPAGIGKLLKGKK